MRDRPGTLLPGDTIGDEISDPMHDVAAGAVDIVALTTTVNSASAELGLTQLLRTPIPTGGRTRHAVFLDRDGNPATGGSPSVLGFPTSITGVDLVALVAVESSGPAPSVWTFQAGSFVLSGDTRIAASASTLADASLGLPVGGIVSVQVPLDVSGPVSVPARVQAFAETVGLTVNLSDQLPNGPTNASTAIRVEPLRFPTCAVTPSQACPGDAATVGVAGLVPSRSAKVILGDVMVAMATTEATGSATIPFAIPTNSPLGLRLVTIGTVGTALTADCTILIADGPPIVVPPPDVSVPSCGLPVGTVLVGTATASDSCTLGSLMPTGTIIEVNGSPTNIPLTPTTLFPLGTSVIEWRAVDNSGNVGTATQRVTRTATSFRGPGCLPAFLALTGDGDLTMTGNSRVSGDVGISPFDFLRLTSPNNRVTGSATVFPSAAQVVKAIFSSVGGIIIRDLSVPADAIDSATRVSAGAALQTATPGFPTSIDRNLNSDLTLQPMNPSGVNVLNLSLLSLRDNADLILLGDAVTTYIINVTGSFTVSGNANIILGATLPVANVLFNVVGPGTCAASGDNSTVRGLLLAPERDFPLSINSDLRGLVFARSISVRDNADIFPM